jgi:glycosyltransferase involved in cell wall biosynthesis
VSVLEAMAHGCIPLLSDLPANRELVQHGDNGAIVERDDDLLLATLGVLLPKAQAIAGRNREWVQEHALFPPLVQRFLQRLGELQAGRR